MVRLKAPAKTFSPSDSETRIGPIHGSMGNDCLTVRPPIDRAVNTAGNDDVTWDEPGTSTACPGRHRSSTRAKLRCFA